MSEPANTLAGTGQRVNESNPPSPALSTLRMDGSKRGSNPPTFHLPSSILLLAILLLAAWLRLYRLPELPPGLNFDEAGSGVAALEIGRDGQFPLWWRLGGGQEPLWPYLAALTTVLLGPVPLALRLPAAAAGILTVAALARLLLTMSLHQEQSRREWQAAALWAALGLALSGWHLHFSRLGFRAILLPLFSALAFSFFWEGVIRSRGAGEQGRRAKGEERRAKSEESHKTQHARRNTQDATRFTFHALRFTLAALFTALAIYTYLAARLLWLVPLVWLGLTWLGERWRRGSGSMAGLFPYAGRYLLALLVWLSPLAVYFALHPADFAARSATVSIFNPAWNRGDLVGTAWQTLRLTLGTFFGFGGDPNPLVNLPGQPALPPLLALFFGLGLVTSLYRTIRSRSAASPYLFLLCWWGVTLLPALLAPEGAPHHLRLLGAIVPTYALVGLGMAVATEGVVGWLESWKSGKVEECKAGPSLRRPLCGRQRRCGEDRRRQGERDDPRPITFHVSLITHHAPRTTHHALRSALPLACYLFVGLGTWTDYFDRWPAEVDFTLPYDLYAVRLAGEIAAAPPGVAYVLPMDLRAGEEARHYTLDYLLAARPAAPYTYIPVDEASAPGLLQRAAAGRTELRVVRWTADKHREADAKELMTYLLETSARPVGRATFPVYDVETYALPATGAAFRLPAINRPVGAELDGRLRLEAAFVAAGARPGGWLPVALTLTPLAPMDVDYKASLRLAGPAGERLAQKDRVLLHNFHQGTSLWPPGPVNEYYLLPIPPETPPGLYTVTVVIYHPETLEPLLSDGAAEVPVGSTQIE